MALDTASAPMAVEGGLGSLADRRARPIATALRARFGLVLMVTHSCNLRCTYCYTGSKFGRSMPEQIGQSAIERALASIEPGGCLELGFFGGEPLMEAPLVRSLTDYAQGRAQARHVRLAVGLTTNGTVSTADAWSVMSRPGPSRIRRASCSRPTPQCSARLWKDWRAYSACRSAASSRRLHAPTRT